MYQRTTTDAWEIQGDYGQGWETVCAEETRKEAIVNLKLYRENERGTSFRLKLVRVKITEEQS
jgi:hypothetical protein